MKNFLLTIVGFLLTFTSLAQITTPAGENFDSGTFPPINWAVFDNGVGGIPNFDWAENLTFVRSAPASAYIDRQNLLATVGNPKISQDFLVTPSLTLPQNAQIRFWTTNSAFSTVSGMRYQVRIKLVSDGAQNNPSGYTTVREWGGNNDPLITVAAGTFQEKTVATIPAIYIGVPVYIAFCAQNTQPTSALTSEEWYIDDVKIQQQCFSPAIASLLAAPLFNQASLSWAAVPNTIGYEVENVGAADSFTNIPNTIPALTTATSVVFPGLNPQTGYKFQVRSVCGSGNFGPWVGPYDYQTPVTPPVCGGVFTDSGGIAGNYSNNENDPIVISPDLPTNQVTVAFIAFSTENNTDTLSVYEGGLPILAANLIGTYSGNNSPGTITASSANGRLTFVFTSNGSITRSGWIANVTCAPPPPCAKPTLLIASAIAPTTATINWTQIANPNGTTATNFEYLVLPFPSTEPLTSATGLPTTKPLQLTGLAQGTCFDVYVRSVCSATEKSIWSKAVKFCTTIAPPECGGIFVDAGGIGGSNTIVNAPGNYPNNFNNTATPIKICPNILNPLDKVTVTFTAFNLDDLNLDALGNDGLYIYNGSAVNVAQQISSGNPIGAGPLTTPGAFWGTEIPGPFTSESPDGCLTFVFKSNFTENYSGWVANVTCAPPPTCKKPTALVTSLATVNSVRVAWTPSPITPGISFDVLALPCGSPAPNDTTTGFVNDLASPYIVTGLTSGTCYNFYVRTICSATDKSPWSLKKSAYTLTKPAVCGGNYVDAGGAGFGATFNYANNTNAAPVTICPTVGSQDRVTVTFTEFNTEVSFDGMYVYDGSTVNTANLIDSGNPVGAGNQTVLTTPGAYWGTTIPGSFTSESADGCLTFVFKSDNSVTKSGWLSNITCTPKPFCKKPTQLTVTNTTLASSVILGWTQLANLDGSFANTWKVIAVPCSETTVPLTTDSRWINTSFRPYTFTGLNAGTCYNFYAQAICSGTEISEISLPIKADTQLSCGQVYTDNGGTAANYTANADKTTTICPTNAGDIITVTFTSFETVAQEDGLYVYDGATTSGTLISSGNPIGTGPITTPGAFWGQATPGPFEASTPSGCLTFRFKSDVSLQSSGWAANITCAPAPTCARPYGTAAIPQSTTALIRWLQAPNFGTTSTATEWEVIVQAANLPAPTSTTNGILTTNNINFEAINLNPDSPYKVYVRAICSNSDSSAWSTPFDFDTYPINDECAGALPAFVNQDLDCEIQTPVKIKGASMSTNANGCNNNATGDIWFKFVANNPVQVISIAYEAPDSDDNKKLNFEVYSGNCNSLTKMFCSRDSILINGFLETQSQIDENNTNLNNYAGVVRNLIEGNTYYIRAFKTVNTDLNLNYKLCIGKIPKATEATNFCEQFLLFPAKTGGTRRDLNTVGCLLQTQNASFFKFVVQTSGPLKYTISQSAEPSGNGPTGYDVDFVAWGPFTSEAEATAVVSSLAANTTLPVGIEPQIAGCDYSAAFIEPFYIPNAIACQIYIVMVTNYSNKTAFIRFTQENFNTGGQTLCFNPVKFSYSKKEFCKNETVSPIVILDSGNPLAVPPIPPSVNGVYSIVPPAPASFDTDSGEIDLATIAAGTYFVTNTLAVQVPSGICPLSFDTESTVTVVITEPANASISYATTSFCSNVTTAILPTFTGTVGGLYSATSAGLAIDPLSGAILPISSTPQTYQVTYKIPAIGGCPTFETAPVTIEILPEIVVNAPNSGVVCGSRALPPLTGGNQYYTAPNGTGTIVAAGTVYSFPSPPVKLYVYETNGGCFNQKDFTWTFKEIITANTNFFYDNGSSQPIFCKNGTNPLPFTGGNGNPVPFTGGGIYTSSPAGLVLNPNNSGQVDLFGSTAGNYTVTYTVVANPNTCLLASFTPTPITILAAPLAVTNFTYASATFCKNESNPSPEPLATRTIGGIYSSTAGLVINATTGEINLTASSIGTYVVKYKVLSSSNPDILCLIGTEKTFSVTIKPVITVTNALSYGAAGASSLEICNNASNLTAIRTSTTFTNGSPTGVVETATITGTYSATPAGLVFVSNTTGEINIALSTPNTYTIIFTSDAANTDCRATFASAPFSLKINANFQSVANFTYAQAVYCKNEVNPFPEVLLTRTLGGTYSSTTGLLINSSTGEINLSGSTAGTYTVKYEVAATGTPSCVIADSKTFDVTINSNIASVADFTYGQTLYYKNQTNPSPLPNNTLLFTTGGTYSSNPASGIVFNSTTGLINLLASTSGTYTITYSIAQNFTPCLLANSSPFTLEIKDTFPAITTLSYSNAVYCANESNPSPTIATPARTVGGIYSATPTGLSINASTGAINLTASTAGIYDVIYTVLSDITTGLIGGVTTPPVSVKITAVAVPTFAPQEICQNEVLTLPLESNNVGNKIPGTWLPAITSTTTATPANLTFTFSPEAGQCAVSTSTITVKVKPLPGNGLAGYGITGACQEGDYTLEIAFEIPNSTYKWYNNAAPTVQLTGSESKLIVTELGNYFCDVTVDGCTTRVLFTVTDIVCQIQKGISPNGDNRNDEFDLSTLDVKELEIFSRLGTKVYSKTNYKKEWFGQSDAGDILPDGTYFYVINLKNGDSKTGWIYINK